MKEKIKEWIETITKEKSIEEKIEDLRLKKKDKIYVVVAIILLICINVFQLYDGVLSDDAKYMNTILQDNKESFILENPEIVNAEVVFDSTLTSITDVKVHLTYSIFINQLCIAIRNIENDTEYELIVMPEYYGNNKSIKQLLSNADYFNNVIGQLYKLQQIENQQELTEEIYEDIMESFERIDKLTTKQFKDAAYKFATIRAIKIWCDLILIGVILQFAVYKYYCRKLKKEQTP